MTELGCSTNQMARACEAECKEIKENAKLGAAVAAMNEMEAQMEELTLSILNSNETSMSVSTPEASIQVQKLSLANLPPGTTSIPVAVEGSNVELSVPVSLLSAIGGDAVLSVSDFQPASNPFAPSDNETEDASQDKVEGLISINIYSGSDGSKLAVEKLEEPVRLTLNVNRSSGAECKYWDEVNNAWSYEGLTPVLDESTPLLVCETTHLSFFAGITAGILKTLMCARVEHLSQEGVDALLETGLSTPGMQMLAGMLSLPLLMLLVAIYLDMRDAHLWKDEDFLFAVRGSKIKFIDEENELSPSKGLECSLLYGWVVPLALFIWDFTYGLMEEVILALVSSVLAGFDQMYSMFAEMKNSLMEAFGDMVRGDEAPADEEGGQAVSASRNEGGGGAAGATEVDDRPKIQRMFEASTQKFLFISTATAAGGSSWLYARDSALVWEGILLCTMYLARDDCDHEVVQSRLDRLVSVNEKLMGADVEHQQSMAQWKSYPQTFWNYLVMRTPLGELYTFSITTSRTLRCLFFASTIVSQMAISTLFNFGAGNNKKKRGGEGGATVPEEEGVLADECKPAGLAEKIGSLLVMGTASALLSTVPVAVLRVMHKRKFMELDYVDSDDWKRKLTYWRNVDIGLYIIITSYLSFLVMFVALFVAMIDEDSSQSWSISTSTGFVEQLFVLPAFIAFSVTITAYVLLSIYSRCFKVQKKEVLNSASKKTLQKAQSGLGDDVAKSLTRSLTRGGTRRLSFAAMALDDETDQPSTLSSSFDFRLPNQTPFSPNMYVDERMAREIEARIRHNPEMLRKLRVKAREDLRKPRPPSDFPLELGGTQSTQWS